MTMAFTTFPAKANGPMKWEDLSSLYHAGKYEEALEALLKSDQVNKTDSVYYYNLGTLYFRLGRVGTSIAYLEKANRLSSRDPEIKTNLEFARQFLSPKITAIQFEDPSTWTEVLADQGTRDDVQALCALFGLIALMLWSRTYLKTRSLKKVFTSTPGALASTTIALILGFNLLQLLYQSSQPGICTAKETVRSGPGNHYPDMAMIEEGMKVRVLGSPIQSTGEASQPETWQQVRYADDRIGWMKASSLLTI